MQLASRDKNDGAWSELPPLDGANRFRDLKPGAQMLAESDQRYSRCWSPRTIGAGRVLAFAGDSTWRWWLKGFAGLHERFWRQTMLWLARRINLRGERVGCHRTAPLRAGKPRGVHCRCPQRARVIR